MYEPLFTDLHNTSKSFSIHSIWIVDIANQGGSYALNAEELGDDPNWIDYSLDLFLMINKFRSRMKPPFIGIGHSMGCAHLVYLASIHPRLFHSLVLIEPALQTQHPPGPNAGMFSSIRRERWDSRTKAEAQFRRSPFFAAMDARALDLFLEFGLKDTPDGGVVLATPKAQEAWSFVRSTFHELSDNKRRERMLNPDLESGSPVARLLIARPDLLPICNTLPHIRPRTFYLYGDFSHINSEDVQADHASTTGTGHGGNGGVKEGGVKQEMVEDAGHLCVFEKPGVIADTVAGWLGEEMGRWREEKQFWDTVDTKKSKNGRTELSDEWIRVVKLDTATERPIAREDKAKL
jgi:pimeloyl-ACP methyl ester carboxylesterase